MAESGWIQWTIILVLTALLLSFVVLAQVASKYSAAYIDAPKEVATFIDTVDFSIQENEDYDRDVAKVQRLEDKIRLGRLLREIQKGGDDLREELNGLLLAEGGTTLKTSARVLWAAKRSQLEDRVRRLDLLRMRFLVVYMSIRATTVDKPPVPPPPAPPLPADPEKIVAFTTPIKPTLTKSLTDSITRRPPLRRLTTQAIGHQDTMTRPHKKGWAGVVEELQTSPRMQQRHASIEQAMSQPLSPTQITP
ncbi:hypothetical protein HJFPF1_01915 [Paramyrothecium foliicola]|nr:hypothetical protein HJFPF1_01915 [Paramyrothecium foliicola]